MANRQELLDFLDRHVFDKILHATSHGYSQSDQEKLEDVQKRTRSERDRFHHYGNAQDIVNNYKSDLQSQAAKPVNQELERLKLPTLASVEKEFLRIAGE